MEKITQVYEKRIAVTPERIIEPMIHGKEIPLQVSAMKVGSEPISYEEAIQRPFSPFNEGDRWGSIWDTVWFRVCAEVPDDWKGESVVASINLSYAKHEGFGREGLVYIDGQPTIAINRARSDIPLIENAEGGEKIEFYIEAAANPAAQMGWGDNDLLMPDYSTPPLFSMEKARLATFNREAHQLKLDYEVCHEAMLALPDNEPRRGQLYRALNQACSVLELGDSTSIVPARAVLEKVMSRKNGDTNHSITAVGHAHIDTAWLWPLRETIRKCARTFSTALRYMEKYPDYQFACSQPQQYSWMKKYYPSIYADIKKAVARGQWEPVGGMWIEADCNISSGESLIRQLIHGKNFYEEEFGIEVKDLWLPDVFGYAAALPQILQKAGIQWFLTQKISWNDTNKFPHHTFWWEGLDGSRIFTHFPPVDTYNCQMGAKDLMHSMHNFQENDRATAALIPFGNGDGGGGPTIDHIEKCRRWEDFEGLPKVKMGKVSEFFTEAKDDAIDLPVWNGELYLELHRGTLTSQAYNKQKNRECELLLRDAEFFDAVSRGLGLDGMLESIPETQRPVWDVDAHITGKDKDMNARCLDRAWKLLLLNQFHDIIPGSSIHWVYQDSKVDYANIRTLADAVKNKSLESILSVIDTGKMEQPAGIFNTLSHERTEVVELPNGELMHCLVPPCGYTVIDQNQGQSHDELPPVSYQEDDGLIKLTNGLVSVSIDENGRLISLFDHEMQREVLTPGQRANVFQIHKDIPNFWNAWDIDHFINESTQEISGTTRVKIKAHSELRVTVQVEHHFGDSHLSQDIVLNAGSKRVDFHTQVNWQERNKLLKVSFPVNVRSLRATYDTQFGHVERSTHGNSSWDVAQFEVPVHKWMDLSESDYGVALLNNCKYGADIHGSNMRLTLLKSACAPDPEADRGVHTFSYSLFPHKGSLQQGKVIEEAYAFNSPLLVTPAPRSSDTMNEKARLPRIHSFITIDRPGVILESLKKAEKSDALIARVYEAYSSRGTAEIQTQLPVTSLRETDLLEREIDGSTADGQTLHFDIDPFSIRTFMLVS
ncbi:alpha-mannosidase [Rubritalea squalenifaciens DSM 18772]|uniref:Alpha-mannosidase n=1 Tax=Rubritalea squalenifaciens DSM 18772 TaxID=1123071 RepID=A0A1M6LV07_9BACT|nr:alpha-mannosidase [Rubritalea squalenifaciens]SHJ75098.1 alpha-mannosidase [Rubritalea squalenifaciens DSM 18772]